MEHRRAPASKLRGLWTTANEWKADRMGKVGRGQLTTHCRHPVAQLFWALTGRFLLIAADRDTRFHANHNEYHQAAIGYFLPFGL
jgi:hypothetical protein